MTETPDNQNESREEETDGEETAPEETSTEKQETAPDEKSVDAAAASEAPTRKLTEDAEPEAKVHRTTPIPPASTSRVNSMMEKPVIWKRVAIGAGILVAFAGGLFVARAFDDERNADLAAFSRYGGPGMEGGPGFGGPGGAPGGGDYPDFEQREESPDGPDGEFEGPDGEQRGYGPESYESGGHGHGHGGPGGSKFEPGPGGHGGPGGSGYGPRPEGHHGFGPESDKGGRSAEKCSPDDRGRDSGERGSGQRDRQ